MSETTASENISELKDLEIIFVEEQAPEPWDEREPYYDKDLPMPYGDRVQHISSRMVPSPLMRLKSPISDVSQSKFYEEGRASPIPLQDISFKSEKRRAENDTLQSISVGVKNTSACYDGKLYIIPICSYTKGSKDNLSENHDAFDLPLCRETEISTKNLLSSSSEVSKNNLYDKLTAFDLPLLRSIEVPNENLSENHNTFDLPLCKGSEVSLENLSENNNTFDLPLCKGSEASKENLSESREFIDEKLGNSYSSIGKNLTSSEKKNLARIQKITKNNLFINDKSVENNKFSNPSSSNSLRNSDVSHVKGTDKHENLPEQQHQSTQLKDKSIFGLLEDEESSRHDQIINNLEDGISLEYGEVINDDIGNLRREEVYEGINAEVGKINVPREEFSEDNNAPLKIVHGAESEHESGLINFIRGLFETSDGQDTSNISQGRLNDGIINSKSTKEENASTSGSINQDLIKAGGKNSEIFDLACLIPLPESQNYLELSEDNVSVADIIEEVFRNEIESIPENLPLIGEIIFGPKSEIDNDHFWQESNASLQVGDQMTQTEPKQQEFGALNYSNFTSDDTDSNNKVSVSHRSDSSDQISKSIKSIEINDAIDDMEIILQKDEKKRYSTMGLGYGIHESDKYDLQGQIQKNISPELNESNYSILADKNENFDAQYSGLNPIMINKYGEISSHQSENEKITGNRKDLQSEYSEKNLSETITEIYDQIWTDNPVLSSKYANENKKEDICDENQLHLHDQDSLEMSSYVYNNDIIEDRVGDEEPVESDAGDKYPIIGFKEDFPNLSSSSDFETLEKLMVDNDHDYLLLTDDLEDMARLLFMFDSLLIAKLPNINEHLKSNEITSDLYAKNWFRSNFACDEFSPNVTHMAQSDYNVNGPNSMIELAINVIKLNSEDLLKLETKNEILEKLNFGMNSEDLENKREFVLNSELLDLLNENYKICIEKDKENLLNDRLVLLEAKTRNADDLLRQLAEIIKEMNDYIVTLVKENNGQRLKIKTLEDVIRENLKK